MDPTDTDASLDIRSNEYPDIPFQQPELEVYMAGTPTVGFLEYVELAVDALFR